MRTLTVNGQLLKARAFDFNVVCELEAGGITLADIKNKPLSFIRNYVALCAGTDLESAGKEVEGHLMNGGKLDDILTVMSAELEESDFFRAISQIPEKETSKSKKKAEQ